MAKEVVKIDTTNPFNKGVTYKDFLANVNADKKVTVDSMLKDHKITKEQVIWLKKELEILKNK